MTSKLLLVAALSICVPSVMTQGTGKRVMVDEAGIRSSAYRTVKPRYPEESRRSGAQGVAVVGLQYDGRGEVTIVNVLESPDEKIGKAVADAIWQWKFKKSTYHGEPLLVSGKLTFYFSIDRQGKATVSDPRKLTRKSP